MRTTPPGFPLPSLPSGIVAHLDDPEPAVGAPVEGDRVGHQRLARDQLDREAGPDPDRPERFLGRLCRRQVDCAGGAAGQAGSRVREASRARRLRRRRIGGSSSAGFSRVDDLPGCSVSALSARGHGDTISPSAHELSPDPGQRLAEAPAIADRGGL